MPKSVTKEPKLTEDLRTKVEFSRGTRLENGKITYPWAWFIIIQRGHLHCSSKPSFDTLEECIDDFNKNGMVKFNLVQENMKKLKVTK